MKRKGMKFDNPENYFPQLIRLGDTSSWLTNEVFRFYESRYGSESWGAPDPNGGARAHISRQRTAASKRTADFTSGIANPTGVGYNVNVTVPQPYIPEFASPDRLFFPSDPRQAMKFWRYFYALDPVCGNVIDMYAELMLSDIELAGEGVDGDIRDTMWKALEDTNALGNFRWMVVGYLVDGEVLPHLIWDDEEGRWIYLGFQDPLNIKVVDVPFVGTQPYVELNVSNEVRRIITNPDPRYQRFRDAVPPEFMQMLQDGRGIPLNTEENVTFIPRRLSPYDVRGISIFSRLWRTLIFEDAVFNACFVKGTEIYNTKYQPIKIEDVKVGDRVLDRNGHIQVVEDAWEEDAKDIAKVTLFGGMSFECTPHHRFPVFAYPRKCQYGCGGDVNNRSSFLPLHSVGKKGSWSIQGEKCINCGGTKIPRSFPCGYNPYQELQAQNLKKHDYLMIPRYFEPSDYSGLNKDQARLLGYYVAGGRKVKLGGFDGFGIQWTFNIGEKGSWVKDISGICSELGVETHQYEMPDRNNCVINFAKREYAWLSTWLTHHGGTGSRYKQLSAEVMGWPLELKVELIRGLFRGDGSFTQRGKYYSVRYATASYVLAHQVMTILHHLGIFASIHKYKNRGSLLKNGKDKFLYCVDVGNVFARKLINLVWQKGLDENRYYDRGAWVDDNYVYVPVKKVELKHKNCKVFNLTVSGDHSYLVSGVGTFNTIQTARRHAAPVKVVKMGNSSTGWIPGPEHERRLRDLLAIAETDPHAWLVYHYGINFEAWGTAERVMTVSKEWDIIERIKLIALGVSKAFLTGEVTYCVFNQNANVLLSNGEMKHIVDVQKGDQVIDRFGASQVVEEVLTFDAPEKGVEITTYGGKKLFTTENHRFPVFALPRTCACGCDKGLPNKVRPINNRHGNCYGFTDKRHRNPEHPSVWKEYRNGGSLVIRTLVDYEPHKEMEARDIRRGDYLMIPRRFTVNDIQVNDTTKAQARFLGYYLAKGYINYNQNGKTRTMVLTFGKDEKGFYYAQDVVKCLQVIGISGKIDQHTGANGCYWITCSEDLDRRKDFLTWVESSVGREVLNKKMSEEIMHWPLELKKELIRGMFRGDGHYHQRKGKNKTTIVTDVVYSSASEQLIRQVELILAQLGYPSTIWCDSAEKRASRGGGSLGNNDLWKLAVCGKRGVELLKLIWEDVDPVWKRVMWKTGISRKDVKGELKDAWVDDDYIYIRVKDVKFVLVDRTKYPKVYSLTVKGTHSYTIDNVASYNSSAEKGLQVFLERLRGMRSFFEQVWWYPRFFGVMAKKNDWIKPTQAELSHRVRIRRSRRELNDDNRYIIPTIVWQKSLDSQSNMDKVRTYIDIKTRLGINISRSEVLASMGLDWEEQETKSRQEAKILEELDKEFGVKDKVNYYKQLEEKAEGGGSFGTPGGPPPGLDLGIAPPPEAEPVAETPGETPPETTAPATPAGGEAPK